MHKAALLCLALSSGALAQEDPDLRFLTDYAETRAWQLGRPASVRVTPDGSTVLFLRALPRNPELRLFAFDVKTARVRELVTPEQVLGGAGEQLSPGGAARSCRSRAAPLRSSRTHRPSSSPRRSFGGTRDGGGQRTRGPSCGRRRIRAVSRSSGSATPLILRSRST